MPQWVTSMEAPAIDPVGYRTTQEEILALYHEVYQLKRAPRTVQGDLEATEETHQEILASLKEHFQCRQCPTQPEEQEQGLAGTSRSDPWSDFHQRMQVTYDHFQSRQQESCKEALRVVRNAHHQALAAAALLDGHIKTLSHSISCGWSGSHGQLGSHWHSCSRRCTRSHRRCLPVNQQEQIPSVVGCPGDSAKRWAPSPSPVRSRRQVIFKESGTGESASVWESPPQPQPRRHLKEGSELTKGDLGPPPSLDLDLEHFLGGCLPQQGAERGRDPW